MTLVIKAPAKINSFLRVIAKEDSGYHQIESLLTAVNLYDEIRLTPNEGGISLKVIGADIGPIEDNLVYKAATTFFAKNDITGGVDLTLRKVIPTKAGLGGGSSDAGATIRALNLIFDQPYSSSDLIEIACELGSDVPFFASGFGTALAWGRGERLIPMEMQSYVLLALTSIPIETKWAYHSLGVSNRTNSEPVMPENIGNLNLSNLQFGNHFEPKIFKQFPKLKKLHKEIMEVGASVARLSGSGGSLFGLFPQEKQTHKARDELAKSWPDVRFLAVQTLGCQPDPDVLI